MTACKIFAIFFSRLTKFVSKKFLPSFFRVSISMVFKCVLSFCGLDFVCALSNMRSSNKKCGLNPALPKKHAVLKVPISQPQQSATNSTFAQHISLTPSNLPLQFDPSPLIVVAPHPLKLTPNFTIFQKILPFSGRTRKSTFSLLAQKMPVFQRPRTRRILELQTCKQVFYDLQIP